LKIGLVLLLLLLNARPLKAQVFEVLNPDVQQGDTAIVKIAPQWHEQLVCISVFGNQYAPNKFGYAVIGVKSNTKEGRYLVFLVECGRGVVIGPYQSEIRVWAHNFVQTRTASFTNKPKTRSDAQQSAMNKAFQQNYPFTDLTNGPYYIDPLGIDRDVIDPFGPIYRNNPYLFHTGVDLRVPVGAPIKAVNGGKVVLVAKRFYREGNMVIISHGLGIFSMYMHLSKFRVKNGDTVQRGEVIGFSGTTGAGVREPHLHFNIKIQDTFVDPLRFIDILSEYLYSEYLY